MAYIAQPSSINSYTDWGLKTGGSTPEPKTTGQIWPRPKQ